MNIIGRDQRNSGSFAEIYRVCKQFFAGFVDAFVDLEEEIARPENILDRFCILQCLIRISVCQKMSDGTEHSARKSDQAATVFG